MFNLFSTKTPKLIAASNVSYNEYNKALMNAKTVAEVKVFAKYAKTDTQKHMVAKRQAVLMGFKGA